MRIRWWGLWDRWKIDDVDLEIMEEIMVGFVLSVIGKWSNWIRWWGLWDRWKIDDVDLEIMEEIMVGFVLSVIGKWSKVVVFVLEPPFYYLPPD